MIGKTIFFITALTILPGCALRSMERNGLRTADGLSVAYPADADRLARETAAELSRRYAPAQTGLALLVVPGQFSASLEQSLRSSGFAVATGQDAPGVRVGTVVDVIQGELAPSGYVEVHTSDGQRFSLVRRLKGDSLPAPLVATSEPVVEAPFTMPDPISSVQATPLAENVVSAAGPGPGPVKSIPSNPERQILTPEKETPAPSAFTPAVLLPKAVLMVLPYNWRFTIPDADRRQVKVGTSGNIPWREAIRRMGEQAGCAAEFDETARRVTLNANGPVLEQINVPVPVPVPNQPLVRPGTPPVSALHPASLPETPITQASSQPESPVVVDALHKATHNATAPAPASESVAALLAPSNDPVLPAEPVSVAKAAPTPEIPEEIWTLESGSLYAQLGRWTEQAGYQLVWKTETDLTMESATAFRGGFLSVVKQLFTGLNKAGHSLRVTLYQSNNVMEVRGE